jgi:hypothetical protein
LKWLQAGYRPGVARGNPRGYRPAAFQTAFGASPSGKAVDFDSTMRRFESSRPSQRTFNPLSLLVGEGLLVCLALRNAANLIAANGLTLSFFFSIMKPAVAFTLASRMSRTDFADACESLFRSRLIIGARLIF